MPSLLLIPLLASVALPALALPSEPVEAPPLRLGLGEQRLLPVPGLARYSAGGPAIRVHPLPGANALLVKGVAPGHSDLWVWFSDGTTELRSVHVERSAEDGYPPALSRALDRLGEVEIVRAGQGVVLRGELRTRGEAARVAALVQGFPKDVADETEPTASLVEEGRAALEGWIRAAGLEDSLRLERRGADLWLRGSVERPAERAALESRARARYPLVRLELDALPDRARTVHFRVYLLEVSRKRSSALGLAWPPGQPGAFRITSAGFENLLQLELALDALEQTGDARLLSAPELVVRAPGEAELFSGGELPIRIRSPRAQNIYWKNFGLTLKLKVTHTAGEAVRLDISTEVSHLDSAIANDEVPGIQSNRMSTQVDARFGAPLLLSGLLQQSTREAARGLPLLQQIPVLGLLFGSEDYLSARTELVAILVPSSTPPPPPMHRVERTTPKGPAPPPRGWVSPEKARALRLEPTYPWNVLQ